MNLPDAIQNKALKRIADKITSNTPVNRQDALYMLSTNDILDLGTIAHHVSLGCPFTCNFCGVVSMVNGKTSAQTAESAARGVERLVREYGANAIEFYDNNFFLGEKRTRQFCDEIAAISPKNRAFSRYKCKKYNFTAKYREFIPS